MMTTCPLCAEHNDDNATKCRYCQSDLLAVSESALDNESHSDETASNAFADNSEYSTSVSSAVDNGLVKFAKFVAASLSLFAIIGLFYVGMKLVGIASDLANAEEQIRTTEQRLSQVNNSLGDRMEKLDERERKLDRLQIKTETVWSRVEQTYNRIQNIASKPEAPMIGLEGASSTASVPIVTNELTEFTKGYGKLWPPGTVIDIAFLEGNSEQQQAVKLSAVQWSEYANLTFNFDSATNRSDIRISFEPASGNWSYIGTDAKHAIKSVATMNFDPSLNDIPSNKSVLRQFGYAIGLLDEHQNPSSNILWDYDAAHEKLSSSPKLWSPESIDRFLLGKWAADAYPNGKPYDSGSIMHERISAELTVGTSAIAGGSVISEGDKQWVGLLYP